MADYSLAERLRVARAHKGWSQTELAKRARLHSVQISKLERGITKEITGSTLRALCQALGVSPAYILGMTDDLESEVEPAAVALVGA
jgi:transcriptional regulator with XRE-family HTH domain